MLKSLGLALIRLHRALRRPGKLNRALRHLGAHYHWQNLSAEDGTGRWPRHGRAWLHRGNRCYGVEWSLFRLGCGISVESTEQANELTLHLAPLFGNFFLTVPCPRWFERCLPRHHYLSPVTGLPDSYALDREISLRIHGGCLWWRFMGDPMEWSASTPRWRDGSFDPVRFLFGRETCETRTWDPKPVLVPMPEGNYAATVRREDRAWRRSRWPWTWRRRTSYWLDIPGGIPFEGKGENSWDCGTDGIFGCGGETPESAIARVVESVMRNRKRYGTPREIREAEQRMAPAPVYR